MAADMDMFVCSFVYPLQEAVEEILWVNRMKQNFLKEGEPFTIL